MKTVEFNKLSEQEQNLVLQANQAQDLAYAPYSNFYVGTAILLENDEILLGANQENASYPLCLCAERVALSYASMHRPEVEIKAIAITTSAVLKVDDIPAPPCGACRQVLMEYQQRQTTTFSIYLVGHDNRCWIYESIHLLLPHSFGGDFLKT